MDLNYSEDLATLGTVSIPGFTHNVLTRAILQEVDNLKAEIQASGRKAYTHREGEVYNVITAGSRLPVCYEIVTGLQVGPKSPGPVFSEWLSFRRGRSRRSIGLSQVYDGRCNAHQSFAGGDSDVEQLMAQINDQI